MRDVLNFPSKPISQGSKLSIVSRAEVSLLTWVKWQLLYLLFIIVVHVAIKNFIPPLFH